MWYNLTEKMFVYEGDLDLLGIADKTVLPENIVEIAWTQSPVSNDPLIGYKAGEPALIDGKWQIQWVEVTYTQEEFDEIKEQQDKVNTEVLESLTPKVQ